MRTRKFKWKDLLNDFLLLLGQIALFVVCIGYISYYFSHHIAPDKKVAEEYTLVNCKVLNKGLTEIGGIYHRYRAEFRLGYETPNGPVEGIAFANGIDKSYSSDLSAQQAYLDEFENGSVYPCWYNPANTAQVVLVLRHSWYSTMPLIFPSLIALIMLFYMVKDGFELVENYLSIKKRKSR